MPPVDCADPVPTGESGEEAVQLGLCGLTFEAAFPIGLRGQDERLVANILFTLMTAFQSMRKFVRNDEGVPLGG